MLSRISEAPNPKYDFDIIIDKIEQDLDLMTINKDIQENIFKYKNNAKKILDVRENLQYLQNEINDLQENKSDELIDNTQFMNYITELEKVKKELCEIKKDFNNTLKLYEVVQIHKRSINKIKQCKDYLENQKIEIIVLD